MARGFDGTGKSDLFSRKREVRFALFEMYRSVRMLRGENAGNCAEDAEGNGMVASERVKLKLDSETRRGFEV